MLMRSIGERPQLYGSERSVDGLLVGFAALAIKVERGGDLGANLNTARALAFMATRDVPRPFVVGPELCDEALIPDERRSFDALRRHAEIFFQLLVGHIENDEPDRAAIERHFDSMLDSSGGPSGR